MKDKTIQYAIDMLTTCFRYSRKLLVCGNGGSASDAEHITTELMKNFLCDRKYSNNYVQDLQMALPTICLNSNTSLITAIANDMGYDKVFSQQVMGYGKEDDVLLAISTSGTSPNIIEALKVAKYLKMKTILLTGGRSIIFGVDCHIKTIDEIETYKVQEEHVKIYHHICKEVEKHFFEGRTEW